MPKELEPFEVAMAAAINGEVHARRIPVGELAERSDIPIRTLSRYLKGERSMTLGPLMRLADALEMPMDELLAEARKRQRQQFGSDAE
jgi:transcriptional regulator with XRE-family HTH domain